MDVKFLDLHRINNFFKDEFAVDFINQLDSGSYVLGPSLQKFERNFASYVDAKFCIGVANGLDALYISLLALDIGPGHEVIVPSHTFIATWLAVMRTGAKIIPVECEKGSYNISVSQAREAITKSTKAIIPVHLYGIPADIDGLIALKNEFGFHIVEDAAQAHGAVYKGRKIGSHGDLIAWSFYPGKNLGCIGDGGGITTNDPVLFDRCCKLRNYGSSVKYVHDLAGINSRLDPIQAGFLDVKLKKLAEFNDKRTAIAKRYSEEIRNDSFKLPAIGDDVIPAWHLYVVQHDERDRVSKKLAKCGVETLVHYPVPPHLQGAFGYLGYSNGDFPIAESYASRLISLPMDPLMDEESVSYVIDQINSA